MAAERMVEPRMGVEPCARPHDRALAEVAARQHGVVARQQLLSLGLSRQAIGVRRERRQLHPLHRGVYAVGYATVTRHGRWMAATLAGGPGTVLSHRSAAAVWGILPYDGVPEITTERRLLTREGLTLHSADIPLDERTHDDGIPVTTVPRTLLDLAAVVPPRRLERALHEAEVLRLADALSLPDLLARHPGRRRAAALRALLADAALGATVTRQELEHDFATLVAGAGLPRPVTNVLVEGHEVDAVWREHRLIVELDGRAVHGTRRAFEADRARDRALTIAGWRVVRITWRQLHRDGPALTKDLHRLLHPLG